MTAARHRLEALLLIGLTTCSVRSAMAQGVAAKAWLYRELQGQVV